MASPQPIARSRSTSLSTSTITSHPSIAHPKSHLGSSHLRAKHLSAPSYRQADVLDPERGGCYGGSHGGFLTAWLLGHPEHPLTLTLALALTLTPTPTPTPTQTLSLTLTQP